MAKFCNKCGKELVDGKCPDCDKEEKEIEEVKTEAKEEKKVEEVKVETKEDNVSTEETSEIGKKVAEYLKLFLNTAKGMFKTPEKTLKEKNIDWIIASIVMIINSILFGFAINNILSKTFSSAAFSMMSSIGNGVAGLFGKSLTSISDISRTAGIGFAVNCALIVIIVWVMHEIVFRKKLNILTLISLEGKCQCLFTIEVLITIVVSYFSVILAILLLPIFVISCLINIHYGIIAISKIKEDQIVYVTTLGNLFPVISITISSAIMIILQISTSGINNIL